MENAMAIYGKVARGGYYYNMMCTLTRGIVKDYKCAAIHIANRDIPVNEISIYTHVHLKHIYFTQHKYGEHYVMDFLF